VAVPRLEWSELFAEGSSDGHSRPVHSDWWTLTDVAVVLHNQQLYVYNHITIIIIIIPSFRVWNSHGHWAGSVVARPWLLQTRYFPRFGYAAIPYVVRRTQ